MWQVGQEWPRSHRLPTARPLAGTHPALGQVRLMGRGLVNLTLPAGGSLGGLGQELPPHRGRSNNDRDAGAHHHQAIVLGRERWKAWGTSPHSSPGPVGWRLESLGRQLLLSTAQGPPAQAWVCPSLS